MKLGTALLIVYHIIWYISSVRDIYSLSVITYQLFYSRLQVVVISLYDYCEPYPYIYKFSLVPIKISLYVVYNSAQYIYAYLSNFIDTHQVNISSYTRSYSTIVFPHLEYLLINGYLKFIQLEYQLKEMCVQKYN